jgi:hypothetical protein
MTERVHVDLRTHIGKSKSEVRANDIMVRVITDDDVPPRRDGDTMAHNRKDSFGGSVEFNGGGCFDSWQTSHFKCDPDATIKVKGLYWLQPHEDGPDKVKLRHGALWDSSYMCVDGSWKWSDQSPGNATVTCVQF